MLNLYAVHGFLGLPSDWVSLFKQKFSYVQHLNFVDLFSYSIVSLENWAADFNLKVKKQPLKGKNIICGYSLGGRLAMHALLQDRSLWQGAIIISAHSGLSSEEEKLARRQQDANWALNFETLEWTHLINAWNSQEIFKHTSALTKRNEECFSRKNLSAALRNFSLGIQSDLKDEVEAMTIPILWMTGKNDGKLCALAKQMHLKDPLSKICEIPLAGHRAPWEQPERFLSECESFLLRLNYGEKNVDK